MAKHRFFAVFFRGAAMGAADVVPGVSGGTVAYITGIYDELIDSIKSFDIAALKLLLRGDIAGLWRHVNAAFLLSLLCGIVISIVTLARFISIGLEIYPVQISAFFFGLILASAIFIQRQIPAQRGQWLYLTGGLIFALLIGEIRPVATPVTPFTVFLSGAVAICAMILPGISGSFILLIAGMYAPIIGAIKSVDVVTVAIFGGGCAAGLMSFVRLLSWLLHQHRAALLAFLTGVLFGSLSIIWPWKDASDVTHVGGAAQPANILPWQSDQNAVAMFICLLLACLGVALVLGLERFGAKSTTADASARRR